MSNFYKRNEKKLRENFEKQMAEFGSLGSVADPQSRETMLSAFVQNEEQNNAGAYKATPQSPDFSAITAQMDQDLITQNLRTPETYVPPKAEITEVPQVTPLPNGQLDNEWRSEHAPNYIKPRSNLAFPGVIHNDLESLKAAEEALRNNPRSGLEREDWHYNRNLNNHIPATRELAIAAGWPALPESKNTYHKWMAKDKYNTKYTSPDGHFELVLDGHGNIVRNPESVGTYNYHSPDDVKNHTMLDVEPYFQYGNTRYDSTSMSDRLLKSKDGVGPGLSEWYSKIWSFEE